MGGGEGQDGLSCRQQQGFVASAAVQVPEIFPEKCFVKMKFC